ncbi:MAG: hypothetical protein EXQ74_05075 [Thermoleophilia bacterium]|nr:hypothetical protein [Thermoleophilia bacterium]
MNPRTTAILVTDGKAAGRAMDTLGIADTLHVQMTITGRAVDGTQIDGPPAENDCSSPRRSCHYQPVTA